MAGAGITYAYPFPPSVPGFFGTILAAVFGAMLLGAIFRGEIGWK